MNLLVVFLVLWGVYTDNFAGYGIDTYYSISQRIGERSEIRIQLYRLYTKSVARLSVNSQVPIIIKVDDVEVENNAMVRPDYNSEITIEFSSTKACECKIGYSLEIGGFAVYSKEWNYTVKNEVFLPLVIGNSSQLINSH